MSSDSNDPLRGTGRRPPGAQGASRGGHRPDDPSTETDESSYNSQQTFSGSDRGNRSRGTGWRSEDSANTFLGLPIRLIYALGAAIIGLVFIGAVCGAPAKTGTVSGQIKALNAAREVNTLAGAQVILRGSSQTYTTVSTDVDPNAEGDKAYNYRLDDVPSGKYTMAVTPPQGSGLQPESDISLEVKGGELFPQSVMLLAEGIQKPRALAPSELEPGQVGYINDRGERVVYQQGSGFDAGDALLMYLLWRNPPLWGYGYPPVIVNNPTSTSTSSRWRVEDPPTRTSTGQTVTQRPPAVPGQGSTRPSSSTGVTGSGPTRNNTGTGDAVAPSNPSSSSSSSSSTQTKPSSGSSTGSSTTTQPRVTTPSQGATRPSSSTSSRPSSSSSSSSSSRSSSGSRK